jgi:hypothetical protein
MIIITGASNNHYLSLINMINSFIKYNNNNKKLIIYNLGLDNNKWSFIQDKFKSYNFLYKIFDYSKYPSWFNINIEAGQYAWKPVIIYNTYLEFNNEIIIWMDSGNLIKDNLEPLKEYISTNHIYSATSDGNIKKWTHPETIKYLNCSWINKENRNGACLGFNTKTDFVKNFLLEFYNCAQDKNCIAPNGSNRQNHRQDQAVFSILFYKYLNTSSFLNNYLGYTIHNDV